MKRLAWTAGAVLYLAAVAPAQSAGYSGAFYYDVRDHQTFAVVARPVTTVRDIRIGNVPKFSLDLVGFVGAGTKDGQMVGGFALTRTWHVAANFDLMLGAGFAVRQGDKLPSSTGPMLGLKVTF